MGRESQPISKSRLACFVLTACFPVFAAVGADTSAAEAPGFVDVAAEAGLAFSNVSGGDNQDYILETMSEEDVFDESDLARINCPTAVIWGEHDGLFPLATGERIAAALPHGELTVIRGAAHGVHWELPNRMNAAIEAFRVGHPARR